MANPGFIKHLIILTIKMINMNEWCVLGWRQPQLLLIFAPSKMMATSWLTVASGQIIQS